MGVTTDDRTTMAVADDGDVKFRDFSLQRAQIRPILHLDVLLIYFIFDGFDPLWSCYRCDQSLYEPSPTNVTIGGVK